MKKIYFLSILLFFTTLGFSQETATPAPAFKKDKILKLNLSSLALTNVHFQYEQVLNPHSSFAIAASFLPERGVWGSPEDIKDARLSGYSFTPEYRYHFSGKGAKGFYVAPYFRYANYSTNAFAYRFEKDNGERDTLDLQEATYTTMNFGLMFGAQWKLGNHLTLDFWIVGAGVGSSEFEAKANGNFSQSDQTDFNNNLADIKLPIGSVTGTMTSNTAIINYKSPVALRGMSICIGYIF